VGFWKLCEFRAAASSLIEAGGGERHSGWLTVLVELADLYSLHARLNMSKALVFSK
jgi:hypothetical protein